MATNQDFNQDQTRVEIMWGVRILDAGFTNLPNLIIRHATRVGLTKAEFHLMCIILTFKHDTNDPYPSQETLARYYFGDSYNPNGNHERQIRRLVESMESKGFLITGYRYIGGTRSSSVYNFEPLVNAVLDLDVIENAEKPKEVIHYKKPKKAAEKKENSKKTTTGRSASGSAGNEDSTTGRSASGSSGEKRPTKNPSEKDLKNKTEKEDLSIQKELETVDLPIRIKQLIKKKSDRLIFHNLSVSDIFDNYELHKSSVSVAQYRKALDFALDLKTAYKKGLDAVMAKNVETVKGFANKETASPSKPVRKEIVPDEIKKQAEIEAAKEAELEAVKKDNKASEDDLLQLEVGLFLDGFRPLQQEKIDLAIQKGFMTQEDVNNRTDELR